MLASNAFTCATPAPAPGRSASCASGPWPSAQVGRARLRRLLKKGEGYVAQSRVPKSSLVVEGAPGVCLWTDLRVWAYRGERFLISGRASRQPDLIDLQPPGGWLPTYAMTRG